MNLFALGLNHNTAPLALREKVAFSSEELDTANQKIRAMLGNSAGGGIKEVASYRLVTARKFIVRLKTPNLPPKTERILG